MFAPLPGGRRVDKSEPVSRAAWRVFASSWPPFLISRQISEAICDRLVQNFGGGLPAFVGEPATMATLRRKQKRQRRKLAFALINTAALQRLCGCWVTASYGWQNRFEGQLRRFLQLRPILGR